MEKTINLGDIVIKKLYAGTYSVYILGVESCWLNSTQLKKTSEIAQSHHDMWTIPNDIDDSLGVRKSIQLYKLALSLGMNEHEDVTYWVRDYIVEKIRENG